MYNGFYGRKSVRATRRRMQQTGKVTAATLRLRGDADDKTNVSYKYSYVHPQTEATGISADGHPTTLGSITLYREGETSAPRADDTIVVGSTTYQILSVMPRLNVDESSNYAVYDLSVVS